MFLCHIASWLYSVPFLTVSAATLYDSLIHFLHLLTYSRQEVLWPLGFKPNTMSTGSHFSQWEANRGHVQSLRCTQSYTHEQQPRSTSSLTLPHLPDFLAWLRVFDWTSLLVHFQLDSKALYVTPGYYSILPVFKTAYSWTTCLDHDVTCLEIQNWGSNLRRPFRSTLCWLVGTCICLDEECKMIHKN